MKKLLVVLLSLGLIISFGATASAQPTVKFGGSYVIEGAYEDNISQLGDKERFSAAAIWQRLRLQPVFTIAEGLTLTTRLDALEKQWGNTVWKGGYEDFTNSRKNVGATQKSQENIEFERAIVTFKTAIGSFDVGYQSVGKWGTGFNDWENTGARFIYTTKAGPVVLRAVWDKLYDTDSSRTATFNRVDGDSEQYHAAVIYMGKGLEGGLLYTYKLDNSQRGALNYRMKGHILSPYMKGTFGPVFVEAEMAYVTGKAAEFEAPSTATDKDASQYGGYIHGKVNLGPAYVGGTFTFLQGDNDVLDNKVKGGLLNAKSVNPALILMGDDYLTDIFPGGNAYDAGIFSSKKNSAWGLWMYSIYGGFKPNAKIDIMATLTQAKLDKMPTGYVSKKMGTEFDVTATYMIYDNLSYMIGAGYLWADDAFKGTTATKEIGNDYLLMNRLALSF